MSDNKVTPQRIEGLLASLRFEFARVGESTTTACWAFLPNGFSVGYGESACVDPANFNQEIGEKYAKERCLQAAANKLWELEGYLLANQAHQPEPANFVDRMRKELGELGEKLFKLADFLASDKAKSIPQDALSLMVEQGEAMEAYYTALSKRIELHG